MGGSGEVRRELAVVLLEQGWENLAFRIPVAGRWGQLNNLLWECCWNHDGVREQTEHLLKDLGILVRQKVDSVSPAIRHLDLRSEALESLSLDLASLKNKPWLECREFVQQFLQADQPELAFHLLNSNPHTGTPEWFYLSMRALDAMGFSEDSVKLGEQFCLEQGLWDRASGVPPLAPENWNSNDWSWVAIGHYLCELMDQHADSAAPLWKHWRSRQSSP